MATKMATRLRRTYNGSDDAATMLMGSFPTPEDKIVLQNSKLFCHHNSLPRSYVSQLTSQQVCVPTQAIAPIASPESTEYQLRIEGLLKKVSGKH